MVLIETIQAHGNGANFRRADLHIHSFGQTASRDVDDATMTPQAIVDTAIAENLEVIAITDHNRIGNVAAAVEYAADKQLLVIPGIELSTSQGHLLVYFSTPDHLLRFVGQLDFDDEYKMCNHSISQCLSKANEFGGIGIAAHIELSSGFEAACPRYDHFKEEILKSPNLLALEISTTDAEAWYTDRDDNPDRKRIYRMRREHLNEDDQYELGKVMNSDAHSLSALGRNANNSRKLTRLKMDTLTFESFRIALLDPLARVRIEELIPERVPHFKGMQIEGGFLAGQTVHFSNNLTCIIGGRGTGKSTMLESLRATSGNGARKSLLDCEVWPDRVSLLYEDESAQQLTFSRSKCDQVINQTDPENGILQIPIESYGQGETAETIQHCDDDPSILLEFLDQFVEIEELRKQDDLLRDQLLSNQSVIENLALEITAIPEVQKAKQNAERQVEALKQQDAATIVVIEEKLAKGRAFRSQLIERLKELFETRRKAFADKSLTQFVDEMDGSNLVVGQEQFEAVKNLVIEFEKEIETLSVTLEEKSQNAIAQIREMLNHWKTEEAESQNKIDEKRKELEEKGVPLDMAFIKKVTEDLSRYDIKLKKLQNKRGELQTTQKARKDLIGQRKTVRASIFRERARLATSVTQSLKHTVVDYNVTIKFDEGRLSKSAEEIIKSAMGWRTSQVPKAHLIVSAMSPLDLAEACENQDKRKLTEIRTETGENAFSTGEAGYILQTLRKNANKFKLERCAFEDLPGIVVVKVVKEEGKPPRHLSKTFDRLSLGQQQSILLSVMLFSKSNYPLIIDQPEDNLDSEFIYKTFVRVLRTVKERRQVIIVTHNANIAVLGDAELIIPLRASNEKAMIRDRGSIDNPDTKRLTCTILEGSEQAFKKRQVIYGLRT